MPPVARRRFVRRVRSLDPDARADFVAALWEARGRETRREGRVVVATRGEFEERILVGDDPDDGVDVVVDVSHDAGAGAPPGVRVVDASDLYDVSLYAVDRDDAERVFDAHLDLPVTVEAADEDDADGVDWPSLPAPGTRTALVAVVVLVVAASLLAGGLPATFGGFGGFGGFGDDGSSDASFGGDVTFVTPEPTPTPTPTPTATATPARVRAPLPPSFVAGLSAWRTHGYDAGRTGHAPDVVDVRNGTFATARSLDSAIVTSPVVGGELAAGVFVGTYEASVYGLTDTLEVRWRSDVGDVLTATPTLAEGSLYVGAVIEGTTVTRTNSTPTLFALDPRDGARKWAFVPGGSVHAAPAVSNGTVYVTTLEGRLYALNETDGGLRWSRTVSSRIPSGPTVTNGTVYVATAGGDVATFDAETGAERWRVGLDAPIRAPPVVTNGTVYAATVGGSVHALSASTGDERWAANVGASLRASPAVAGGRVFVPDYRGNVTALSAATGERRWTVAFGGRVVASPAVANETVYVGVQTDGGDGAVAALGFDGTRRWQVGLEGAVVAAPTPTDDAVYVTTTDGQIALVVDS